MTTQSNVKTVGDSPRQNGKNHMSSGFPWEKPALKSVASHSTNCETGLAEISARSNLGALVAQKFVARLSAETPWPRAILVWARCGAESP
jgi:hypothetical protein